MIRDPSDGSVKNPEKPLLNSGTSGLPASPHDPDADRLAKSREWLKEFQEQRALEIARALLGESNHG